MNDYYQSNLFHERIIKGVVFMFALKGIGKFLLYALIFFGVIIAHWLVLVLFAYLAEVPFYSMLFSWYNQITQGFFDFLPYTLCALRCYLTNLFLLSVALRFSGRISLFVFTLAIMIWDVWALLCSTSLSSVIMTVIELVFASVLAVRCFKNNLDPDK